MNKNTLEFWVGLFVLLGVTALGFLSFRVASGNGGFSGSQDTYTVYASFDDIGGLKVKAPVRTAGVLVGRVKDIELNAESFQATVALELKNQYRFPADSDAKILTSGLLGEQYIGLNAGGDTVLLENGDALQFTTSAVVLEKLIDSVINSFLNKPANAAE